MERNKMSWKAARTDANMTQEQAAVALDVSKSTIINYEKYRTTPDIDTALRLAAIYGRSIDEIKLA